MNILDSLLKHTEPAPIPFEYLIVRSNKRTRTTSIGFDEEGNVVVNAPPHVSDRTIHKFVSSKQTWVIRHLHTVQKQKPIKHTYTDGDQFFYLGVLYPLKVVHTETVLLPKLHFKTGVFTAYLPPIYSEKKQIVSLRRLFERFYIKQGNVVFTKRATLYAQKLEVDFNLIRMKEVSSIWGSCSREGNLTFNWHLVLAPLQVLDYVVVHELSHLIHHHHQKSFWSCVFHMDLEYKAHIKWLKTHKHLLTLS